jgi:hypothetical protein
VPVLLAELGLLFGVHSCTYLFERVLVYYGADPPVGVRARTHACVTSRVNVQPADDADDTLHIAELQEARDRKTALRTHMPTVLTMCVSSLTYPLHVVATCMAINGSMPGVTGAPYFGSWQDCWNYLNITVSPVLCTILCSIKCVFRNTRIAAVVCSGVPTVVRSHTNAANRWRQIWRQCE